MAMTLVAAAVNGAAAGELSWRRGRTPDVRRGVERQSETSHRDGAVRLVQYEVVSGPSFGDDQRDQLRSVVVRRHEPTGDVDRGQVRAAQLQWGGADSDSRYEEQVRTPFGEEPAATSPDLEREMDQEMSEELFPPLDEPPVEQPPTPSDIDLSLPPPTDEPALPRQPAAEPPRTFQPQPRQQQVPGGRDSFDAEPLPRGTTTLPPQTDLGDFPDDYGAPDEVPCSEELAKLKASTLHDVDLAIGITGVEGEDFPVECSIDDGTLHAGRCWPHTIYMWKASALCHKPLYFEDEALERYGHSWGPCCDPIVSGAHFFSKLAALPYCMGLSPPCECQYALGHYRPGSCAPYMCDPIPIMSRATLIQAGAVVGAAALLP